MNTSYLLRDQRPMFRKKKKGDRKEKGNEDGLKPKLRFELVSSQVGCIK